MKQINIGHNFDTQITVWHLSQIKAVGNANKLGDASLTDYALFHVQKNFFSYVPLGVLQIIIYLNTTTVKHGIVVADAHSFLNFGSDSLTNVQMWSFWFRGSYCTKLSWTQFECFSGCKDASRCLAPVISAQLVHHSTEVGVNESSVLESCRKLAQTLPPPSPYLGGWDVWVCLGGWSGIWTNI